MESFWDNLFIFLFSKRGNLLPELALPHLLLHTQTCCPLVLSQNQMAKPRNEIWERMCVIFDLLLGDMSLNKKKRGGEGVGGRILLLGRKTVDALRNITTSGHLGGSTG